MLSVTFNGRTYSIVFEIGLICNWCYKVKDFSIIFIVIPNSM